MDQIEDRTRFNLACFGQYSTAIDNELVSMGILEYTARAGHIFGNALPWLPPMRYQVKYNRFSELL